MTGPIDPAVERELFDRFSVSARHWGNQLGVDTEDLLHDTAVEFCATLARRRRVDGTAAGVEPADRETRAEACDPDG